jgi:hypothetical protein
MEPLTMHRAKLLAAVAATLFALPAAAADDFPPLKLAKGKPPSTMNGLPLVFSADFEDGKTDRWEPTDPKAWKITEQAGNRVYSQFKASKYKTPVRSPFNRSVVKDLTLGSFVLDVRLQSTKKDYPHRDLCLFFGYQNPSHFYYVHFGKRTDDHANQIFIVNAKPRTKISTKTTKGTNWTNNWHHARIVRDAKTGKIAVYFDDMKKPAMTAVDKTFTKGRVGVGSFDDTGNFDHILVYGEKVNK